MRSTITIGQPVAAPLLLIPVLTLCQSAGRKMTSIGPLEFNSVNIAHTHTHNIDSSSSSSSSYPYRRQVVSRSEISSSLQTAMSFMQVEEQVLTPLVKYVC